MTCSRALPSCCKAASRPPPAGPAGPAVQGASPWAPPLGLSRAPSLECPSWPWSWLSGCVGLLPRWRPRGGAGSLAPGAARPSGSRPSLGWNIVICMYKCYLCIRMLLFTFHVGQRAWSSRPSTVASGPSASRREHGAALAAAEAGARRPRGPRGWSSPREPTWSPGMTSSR